mmetsp:Transcript_24932/g.40181  ORF Transcript_24932/g.40181 Transcript_24932/m.40181 type:complete len:119 (-) Transcript_24932:4-360(-)
MIKTRWNAFIKAENDGGAASTIERRMTQKPLLPGNIEKLNQVDVIVSFQHLFFHNYFRAGRVSSWGLRIAQYSVKKLCFSIFSWANKRCLEAEIHFRGAFPFRPIIPSVSEFCLLERN